MRYSRRSSLSSSPTGRKVGLVLVLIRRTKRELQYSQPHGKLQGGVWLVLSIPFLIGAAWDFQEFLASAADSTFGERVLLQVVLWVFVLPSLLGLGALFSTSANPLLGSIQGWVARRLLRWGVGRAETLRVVREDRSGRGVLSRTAANGVTHSSPLPAGLPVVVEAEPVAGNKEDDADRSRPLHVYRVRLSDGSSAVEVGSFYTYVWARNVAEQFAKLLDRPVEDYVSRKRRAPDRLDVPVFRQPCPNPGRRPDRLRSTVFLERQGERLDVAFRTPGSHVAIGLGAGCLFLILWAVVLYQYGASPKTTGVGFALAATVPGLLGALLVSATLAAFLIGNTLSVTPNAVRYGSLRGVLSQAMPTESIEDVVVDPGDDRLWLVSDEKAILLELPGSLSKPEREWLVGFLRWAIADALRSETPD